MANTPTYLDYLAEANKGKPFGIINFGVLEENGKPERWLLKDPSHLGNLEEIRVYPDACFHTFAEILQRLYLLFAVSQNK